MRSGSRSNVSERGTVHSAQRTVDSEQWTVDSEEPNPRGPEGGEK